MKHSIRYCQTNQFLKYKKYERQNKKLLKMIGEENTQEAVEKENKSTLDKIKDDIDR